MKLFLFFLLWILRRASSFPQSGSKCPADSFLYLSSCFTYFNDRMGWDQAEVSTCDFAYNFVFSHHALGLSDHLLRTLKTEDGVVLF